MQVSGHGFVESIASSVDKNLSYASVAGDADAKTLAPYEQNVEINSTLGTLTLRMPPVSECKGKVFSITALTGATKTVTVAAYATGESHDWAGDFSLNADLDRVLLFSDGRRWWVLTDQFT